MDKNETKGIGKASRRSFLRKTSLINAIGIGFSGNVVATPSIVQPDSHITTMTITETEGATVHYTIDVTGNSLSENATENEDNDDVTLYSDYATAEGWVNGGTDEYTFGDDDRISRVVLEDSGNCEITLSDALDEGEEYNITVRAEEWGISTEDPACAYSFTSAGTVGRMSNLEDNDEIDEEGDTASGYVEPPYEDVWNTTGQFESIHGKPWRNSLIIEVGDLPGSSS